MDIYTERAYLVANLASRFPSVLCYNDPKEPEWPVVYIETPEGQLSWHISPSDLPLFPHVRTVYVYGWDGHDTYTKYDRLAALTQKEAM